MAKEESINKKKNRRNKREMPNAFVILLVIMIVAMISTWIVPSGEFEKEEGPEGEMIVVPGSYHEIDNNPVNLFEFFEAVPEGVVEAADIIVTILIMGGAWAVLNQTGAITSGVGVLTKKLGKIQILIIPIMMIIFSTIAAFIGALELAIVYVPVMLTLAKVLKLDNISAVAISLIAAGGGFSASLTNPFTVGLGQKIAGLPLYSGVMFRLVVLILFVASGILYVMWYAMKVRNDPTKSLMYDIQSKEDIQDSEFIAPKKDHKFIWVLLIMAFALIIFGVLRWEWHFFEISAIFFAISIIGGLISRVKLNKVTDKFVEGAQGVLLAGLVVGLARSILIIVEDGQIIDTISYGLVNMIDSLPSAIAPVGIFIAQSFFNFAVNSGSGQVLLTMPILSPVADLVGITQQTTVLATQMGDGITNLLFPVSGVLMGCLAFGKVPFTKWFKFIMPLIIFWTVLGSIMLVIAHQINWGPF